MNINTAVTVILCQKSKSKKMKKSLYIILLTIASCMVLSSSYTNASSNSRMLENGAIQEDYQKISVYKMKMEEDSVTFSSRSALYYPMDGSVIIDGAYYGVESNSDYNKCKEPSSEFRYQVGSYYTNLD